MSFEAGPANPEPFRAVLSHAPSFDVIDKLPPHAADRLHALRQRFIDLNLVIPKFEQTNEASTAKLRADARLKQLVTLRADGGFGLKEDDSRVVEAQRTLDKATADLARISELAEVRSAAWRTISNVMSACETWLRDGVPAGVVLEDHEVEPPKLAKGETLQDAISKLQRRGRELKADLNRIQSAPYPSAHVRAKVRAEVEALASRGMPVVSDVVEHDRSLAWPMQRLQANVYDGERPTFASTEVVDTLALFAFVHRQALLDALDALVTEESDDAAALTHVEREKRAAVVMGDLLAVEYDEAALTWAAIEERLPVEHRPDISPQAILQVRLVTAPTNGAHGSSPLMSFDLIGSIGRR